MNDIARPVSLSLIMPVYNELPTICEAVERVKAIDLSTQLICVDDGSTDGSRAQLEDLYGQGLVDRLVLQPENRGKGAALRAGIAEASCPITCVQDADLEYDPEDLCRLIEPIVEGHADAVFGSRFLGGPHRVLYFWHRVGNSILTLFSNMMTDLDLSDMETCYKVVRTDLLKTLPLRANRFGIEPELTARLAQAEARIYEVPISYRGRTYAEGKKIDWKDGIAAFWHIFRSNLLPPQATPYETDIEVTSNKDERHAPPRGPSTAF